MQWLIDEYGYSDTELATDVAKGFSLVGEVPQSHSLPKKFVPAELTVDDLRENAAGSNQAIRQMT